MNIVTVEADDRKDEDIVIDRVSVEYISYDGDCIDDTPQILKIFTENNGVARFMVLETTRFAINGIDEMIQILTDFKNRARLK